MERRASDDKSIIVRRSGKEVYEYLPSRFKERRVTSENTEACDSLF
jgi:hypothetical protein